MEPLIELPRNRWHELQALYRSHWPEGVAAVCLLESYICCPGLELEFQFKVYCPDGDMNKGMVAMTYKTDKLELLIHPLQNGSRECTPSNAVENALLKTSLIDWSKTICVPFANNEAIAMLERIKDVRGISVYYDESTKAVRHVLRRQSRQFENISCPPHTYAGPLKAEHISVVDNTWTYQSNSSHKAFETLIKYDLTHVLYSEQHQPLAWVTVNPEGCLSHLYCLEEYRNRGYAEYIAKVACNNLLGKERDVLAYTTAHNAKAQKLFSKLGFETEGHVYWVILTKNKGK